MPKTRIPSAHQLDTQITECKSDTGGTLWKLNMTLTAGQMLTLRNALAASGGVLAEEVMVAIERAIMRTPALRDVILG